MSSLPLVSSKEVIAALKRAGFKEAKRTRGSHCKMVLEGPSGKKEAVTVVVLGKNPIPRGTLDRIIHMAKMTPEEFIGYLNRRS